MLKGNLAERRRASVASGAPLRGDLTILETNLDQSLQEVELAIQAGNAARAEEKMRSAEDQARKISDKLSGR